MQYLAISCKLNAFYLSLDLFKALETSTSKRSVIFVDIFSFLKILPWKNEILAENNFP